MKTLFKLLVLGMLYLLSNTTYAQIVQYSEDGTQGCIDCEEKSGIERDCLCFGIVHFGIFNSQIVAAGNQKEKWLYEQELLLADAMDGTNLYEAYTLSPTGLPDSYDFGKIQRNYFKRAETTALASDYFDKANDFVVNNFSFDETKLNSSSTNYAILNIRKRAGTGAGVSYGDLRYNGQYLRDIPNATIDNLLQEQYNIRANQRFALSSVEKSQSKIKRFFLEEKMEQTLTNKYLNHYNNLDYENAIRFMTKYIAWNKTNRDPSIIQYPFGNPNNIFFLQDNDYTSELIGIADLGQPMDNFNPTIFNEIPDDVALINYAVTSLGNSASSFLNDPANKKVNDQVRKYLPENTFSDGALSLARDLINSHKGGTSMSNDNLIFTHNQAYPSNHPIFQLDLNPVPGSNLVRTWNISDDKLTLPMDHFIGVMESFEGTLHPNTEGSLIRMAIPYPVSWSPASFTNENLSLLFNLRGRDLLGNLPFGELVFDHNLGKILHDGGFTPAQFFQSEFALQGALAIANGGAVDFNDGVILDSSFLKTNAYCVYSELKKRNGNLFRTTIGSFIDDPKYKLYFRVGECKYTDEACTDDGLLESSNTLIIKLENVGVRSLNAAAMLLHEGIHAELFRFVDQAHNGEVDPNDRKRLFDLYRNFQEDLSTMDDMAQHTYMIEKYVTPIAKAIRALDNNKYPLSHYMGFGWDGLRAYDYQGILSIEESKELYRLQAIVNDNTNFNPTNCN